MTLFAVVVCVSDLGGDMHPPLDREARNSHRNRSAPSKKDTGKFRVRQCIRLPFHILSDLPIDIAFLDRIAFFEFLFSFSDRELKLY